MKDFYFGQSETIRTETFQICTCFHKTSNTFISRFPPSLSARPSSATHNNSIITVDTRDERHVPKLQYPATMTVAEGNVGVALGLVIGAGAATGLGSAVVFFPSLVKLASRRVLAGSLGLSAGVMTYVSFVEIFQKAVEGFADAGIDEDLAYIYATLSFFGGVVVMLVSARGAAVAVAGRGCPASDGFSTGAGRFSHTLPGARFAQILDMCVKFLSGDHHHDGIHGAGNESQKPAGEKNEGDPEPGVVSPHCVGCSDDPVAELNEWQQRADEEIQGAAADGNTKSSGTTNENAAGSQDADNRSEANDSAVRDGDAPGGNKVLLENVPDAEAVEQKKLVKMGLSTALAIALHNFPEGLATFVAALDDPSVGAVLAIAIGIHNVPEGLCVALPIYYATGSRWRAFAWGSLSGLSEPVAALLGWAVLANAMSDYAYAILFGLVSGMMVIISMKELVPTAHRYDPEDTVVTYSLIAGMIVIALSLVLFKL